MGNAGAIEMAKQMAAYEQQPQVYQCADKQRDGVEDEKDVAIC